MTFINYFKEQFDELLITLWSKQEKIALMSIIHAIYVADNEFARLEHKDFLYKLDGLNVDARDVDAMSLDEAFGILAKDESKNRLVYIFMADALLKDNDYDAAEQSCIEVMKERYPISGELLDEALKEVRNRKLYDILQDWVKEIKHTRI
jgi:hypothetical protein